MRFPIRAMVGCIVVALVASGLAGLAGLALAHAEQTSDEAQILAATRAHYGTLNSGDVAGHLAHHLPGNSAFGRDASLLNEYSTPEEERAQMQANIDRGIKRNLQLRHVQVKVYGTAAVVTGYVVGTITQPDGTTQVVMDRRSAFLIKQGSQWREAHTHQSPLLGSQQ